MYSDISFAATFWGMVYVLLKRILKVAFKYVILYMQLYSSSEII